MDDQSDLKQQALLRFYSGESPSAICESLGLSADQLADWQAKTDPAELRLEGTESTSVMLLAAAGGPDPAFHDRMTDLSDNIVGHNPMDEIVHVAGELSGDDQTCQRCTRSLALVPSSGFPSGALIRYVRDSSGVVASVLPPGGTDRHLCEMPHASGIG